MTTTFQDTIKNGIQNFFNTMQQDTLQLPSENIQLPPTIGTTVPSDFQFTMTGVEFPTVILQLILIFSAIFGVIFLIKSANFKIGKFMYSLHKKLNLPNFAQHFNKIVPKLQ